MDRRPCTGMLWFNPRAGRSPAKLDRVRQAAKELDLLCLEAGAADSVKRLRSGANEGQTIFVYGGDGTVQRLLDALFNGDLQKTPQLALLGGGTMNVAANTTELKGSPVQRLRRLAKAEQSARMVAKSIPTLHIARESASHYGFIFGQGPVIRILQQFEQRENKHKWGAVTTIGKAVSGAMFGWPREMSRSSKEMLAELIIDGEVQPTQRYIGIFCNTTGKLNPGATPFVETPTPGRFLCLAYAISKREFSLLWPLMARGFRPRDRDALRQANWWQRTVGRWTESSEFPPDKRCINTTAERFELDGAESLYTVDGELYDDGTGPITVTLGPEVALVGIEPAAI